MRFEDLLRVKDSTPSGVLARLIRVEERAGKLDVRLDRVERAWVKPIETAELKRVKRKADMVCAVVAVGGVAAGSLITMVAAGLL